MLTLSRRQFLFAVAGLAFAAKPMPKIDSCVDLARDPAEIRQLTRDTLASRG